MVLDGKAELIEDAANARGAQASGPIKVPSCEAPISIFGRPRLMSDGNAARIALLGVPIEIGASQLGTLMGPDALRTAGIGRILDQLGFAVEDHGNLAYS